MPSLILPAPSCFRRLTLALALGLVASASRAAEAPAAAPVAAPVAASTARWMDPAETDPVFGLDRLHRVALTLTAAEWTVLQQETIVQRNRGGMGGPAGDESDYVRADGRTIHVGGGFGGIFPWVRAGVRVGSLALPDVGLRYKGNSSYNASLGSLHRNLKLKTDFHGGTATWEGHSNLNFNAGVLDPSRLRESLSYAVFRAAGVPAPRTAFAEVTLTVPAVHTDTPLGLYTLVENVNRRFLRRVLPPGNGLLLKPEGARVGVPYLGDTWSAYTNIYRPERPPTAAEQERVMAFARLVNLAPAAEFRAEIAAFLDLEAFLRFVAVNALLVNHDSFLRGSHNYYLYLDPTDQRFRFIPWDQDLSLASFGGSAGVELDLLRPWSTDNPLLQRILGDAVHAARYRAILQDLATRVFTRDRLLDLLGRLEVLVAAPLAAEHAAAAGRGDYFAGNTRLGHGPAPRAFFESRLTHVAAQLDGLGRGQTGER
jgi:spore coat protein H